MDLFDNDERVDRQRPLADRMRPRNLDGFVGQEALVGPDGPIRLMIEGDRLVSMIFWGPPGSGKTTLARIIAQRTEASFIPYSAVLSGIKEIKGVMERAASAFRVQGKQTILFVDEFHRFNKAQQDAFLPMVEDGSIILLGATTENPSFAINSSLISRCRVFVFQPLSAQQLGQLVRNALTDRERGLGRDVAGLSDDAMTRLIVLCGGDARRALNILDLAASQQRTQKRKGPIDAALIDQAAQSKSLLYDKSGEEHFNLISALHKSLRNSDPDAALYWLARMLRSGEDPLYIARRLVRFASEDIGLADPRALTLSVAAMETVQKIGLPEADCALAEAVVFMAAAPKSNALYAALGRAYGDVERLPAEPVPLHLRNAPTALMREAGYGAGYAYAHDLPEGVADMALVPPALKGRRYYKAKGAGFEKTIQDWLDRWDEARKRARSKPRSTDKKPF